MNTPTNRIKSIQGNVIRVDFTPKIKCCSICELKLHPSIPDIKLYETLDKNLICTFCLQIGADLNKIS